MYTIPLYKYINEEGYTVMTTVKPENIEYEPRFRIIAAAGKILTNGEITAYCRNVDSVEGWTEIEDPKANKQVTRKENNYGYSKN